MSFLVTLPEKGMVRYTDLELPAYTTLHVPPLCMAAISHKIQLLEVEAESQVWIVRGPLVFHELNLLIDQGPVQLGEIVTYAFNLSSRQVKIRRGQVISRLVSLTIR